VEGVAVGRRKVDGLRASFANGLSTGGLCSGGEGPRVSPSLRRLRESGGAILGSEGLGLLLGMASSSSRALGAAREKNHLADGLSKFWDSSDYALAEQYFDVLDRRWGPHTIDRFADSRHCRVRSRRFNARFACPGVEAVDAFSQDWGGDNNWVNPPFALVGRVLAHARLCRASWTLIVPIWPRRAWWPILWPGTGGWADFVTDAMELPRVRELFRVGELDGKFFQAPRWRVFALRIGFGGGRRGGVPGIRG